MAADAAAFATSGGTRDAKKEVKVKTGLSARSSKKVTRRKRDFGVLQGTKLFFWQIHKSILNGQLKSKNVSTCL